MRRDAATIPHSEGPGPSPLRHPRGRFRADEEASRCETWRTEDGGSCEALSGSRCGNRIWGALTEPSRSDRPHERRTSHPPPPTASIRPSRGRRAGAEEASPPLDIAFDEAPAEPGPLARGAAVVKSFWRHAPLGPGVYRMIGADDEVLYVGKARSIKKRVQTYTTPERQSIRIARMVAQTCSMVFVTTETEAEALLLEANFIKQLKPRYNVLLRDDKSFPYILIAGGHAAPRLLKHRGARSIHGDYFGPFANAGAVVRTLNALQRAFLLRTCSDSYYDNRTRPCLLLPDQALLGALHRRDRAGRLRRAGHASARLPLRPQSGDPPAARPRHDRGGGDARLRKGGAAARSHFGALGDPGRAERQSALGAGSRRLRHRRGGGAVLHRGVLLPHLPELGQPRLFPARRSHAGAGRGARFLPRPVLSRTAGAAAGAAQPRCRLVRAI